MNAILKALVALLLFSTLLGCVNLNDDSLQKMATLQQKYFVTQVYSTNQATMTDYITSLANLKKSATGENAKIIETEIYLAESFAYENRALGESVKLNHIAFNCSSTEAKAMITYINLAFASINSAEKNYLELTELVKNSEFAYLLPQNT